MPIRVLYTYLILCCQVKKVYNTRIMNKEIRELHNTLIDLVGLMNRPQLDMALIQEAGVSLDRALFPLLVGINRRGAVGVNELADLVGRNYTTVSRQVAKLETLGLIARQSADADRRVNEAVITEKGRVMIASLDAARERMAASVLAKWSKKDLQELARLLRQFADDLIAWRT